MITGAFWFKNHTDLRVPNVRQSIIFFICFFIGRMNILLNLYLLNNNLTQY